MRALALPGHSVADGEPGTAATSHPVATLAARAVLRAGGGQMIVLDHERGVLARRLRSAPGRLALGDCACGRIWPWLDGNLD